MNVLRLIRDRLFGRTDTKTSESAGSTTVLIGPHVELSEEIGELLASQLDKPFVRLWRLTEKYSKEIRYSEKRHRKAHEKNGLHGVYQYMQPFFAHSIKRVVEEHRGGVIQFGPLQSTVGDIKTLNNTAKVLQSCDVVLLLPSEDDDESIEFLQNRERCIVHGKEINEHFLAHHSNGALAKHTFYTKNKSPEQTADEILASIDTNASDIILIGAMGVGKSTIGKLLSSKLKLPQASMDAKRFGYYEEKDYTKDRENEYRRESGFAGVYTYWKQYDVYAVERLLEEHKNCVIDFGAGHSIYEDSEDFARVSEMLAPYANVVLLMPSPDMEESISILKNRHAATIDGVEEFEFLVKHPSSRELADFTVFTGDRTPTEIMIEILTKLNS